MGEGACLRHRATRQSPSPNSVSALTGGYLSRGPALTAFGCPFTDAQLAAIVEAAKSWQVGQIQGFRYGKRLVIRDCMRKPGQQEIWEGVADRDDDAFYRQCEIEQLRAAIAIGLAETESTAAGVPVREGEG